MNCEIVHILRYTVSKFEDINEIINAKARRISLTVKPILLFNVNQFKVTFHLKRRRKLYLILKLALGKRKTVSTLQLKVLFNF